MFRTPASCSIAFLFAVLVCSSAIASTETTLVERIILESNNAMDVDEFSYLTNIAVGAPCCSELLAKAQEILGMKKRFKQAKLTSSLNPVTNRLTITCKIEPNSILKRVKIKGILTNKTMYESLYNLQAGEVFSQAQHEASIKAIKDRLNTDGFLLATVSDEVSLHQETQTITVTITIETGPRFFIKHIQCSINLPDTPNKAQHAADIQTALTNIFNPLIHRYQYTQSTIRGWMKKMQRVLTRLGFPNPKLHVKIFANKRNRKVNVVFNVTSTTARYIAIGNKNFPSSQLLTALAPHISQSPNLKPAALKHHLKLLYQTKGYWNPEIKISTTADTITLDIDEGAPLMLSSIRLHDITKAPLPPFLTNLSRISPSTRCTSSFIKKKLHKISQIAVKYGFWDCSIKRTKIVIPRTNPTACFLDIGITLGEQRILKNVTITPASKRTQLPTILLPETYKNVSFNPEIITNLRRALLSDLYQRGYWYASVECLLTEIPKKDALKPIIILMMTCRIDPGERVKFGKIITQGYTKLPFKQILKNCQLPEGSLWDQKKIEGARARLHHLGIFEHVQLTPHQLAQHTTPKHIIANILDDAPYEARIKLGFFASSDAPFLEETSTLRLAGTYIVKNPLNRADILSFTAQADHNEQLMSAHYAIPDLFGNNQLNSVTLITQNHRYMLNLTEPIEAALERRTGLRVTAYQPPVLNESQFGWSAGVDHSRLLGHHGNMNLDISLTEKSLFFLYFTPSYKKVSIDERKTMAEGLETFAELKFSFPIISHGNSPAVRFLLRQRFAKNLHKNIGVALSLCCGHLFSDGPFSTIHPNDRFYLGGADSVRGYSRDTLPPLGTYTTRAGSTGYTVQGGRSMMHASIELRYKLSNNAEFQLFHDLGALAQNSLHDLFTGPYRTFGAGTRVYTPVGTIRFDIGWKLDRIYPQEHSYNWHLSFDGSF